MTIKELLEADTILVYSIKMNQLGLFDESEEIPLSDITNPDGLYELSVDAYFAVIYAQMSELPIKKEILRFTEKVRKAGQIATGQTATGKQSASNHAGGDRAAAARAATDRADPDVLAVLKAAGKVQHEIHRMTGFLRFSLDSNGVYTARCAPDHYILPALAEHFTLRFGETPWAIIDEKRRLCLSRKKGGLAAIGPWSPDAEASSGLPAADSSNAQDCSWEDLWRLYHRSIDNKARNNPHLQQQLIPERYKKYLTEF